MGSREIFGDNLVASRSCVFNCRSNLEFFVNSKRLTDNGPTATQICATTNEKLRRNYEDCGTSFDNPSVGSIQHGCLWRGTRDPSGFGTHPKQRFFFWIHSCRKPWFSFGHSTPNVVQQRSHYRKRLSPECHLFGWRPAPGSNSLFASQHWTDRDALGSFVFGANLSIEFCLRRHNLFVARHIQRGRSGREYCCGR